MDTKSDVVKLLSKAAGLKESEVSEILEIPPSPELGDYALPCFKLAAKLKSEPKKIAYELSKKIKLSEMIKEVKVVGPYVNVFLNQIAIAENLICNVVAKGKNFGAASSKKGLALVEFVSPNTNKPLHLGHLRNAALGESVCRILESEGHNVVRACLYNDRGVHICKSMLAYKKWGGSKTPKSEKIKPDHFVGDYYVMFAKAAAENPKLEEEAQEMLRKWEAGDKNVVSLWKKLDGWALAGFARTFKDIGISFDKYYAESKHYKAAKSTIIAYYEKGLFKKDESGNIIADLSKENLPNKVVLRADGTSVYTTQDVALAKIKYDEFKPEISIYVVADEQNLHFQQLFAILKKLGIKAGQYYHMSYGLVNLPEGRMKSREGTVVDADDLVEELRDSVKIEIESRHDHALGEKKTNELAHKIGLAALKYYLLKFHPKTTMTFDPKKSIALEGDTGPYLQYALVRARKILQKAGKMPNKASFNLLQKPEEINLVKKISAFPEVVAKSGREYAPNLVANYAFELANSFSSFYEACPVIAAESEQIKNMRLKLVQAFAQVLKNALYLLGIDEVDVM